VKLVIDTSALHQDYLLRRTALVSLATAQERAGTTLIVPEVVVLEHAKHLRDARRSAATDLQQAARDVEAVFEERVPIPDLSARRDDCEARIRTRLKELGIDVRPHPATSHAVVAARAVSRTPPFSQDGRGYQDSLIWLSVLELLGAAEPIVLVSSDGVFGQKSLATELVEEAAQVDADVPVYLAKTLTAALQEHVQPRLERLDLFEAALANGTAKLNLQQWLAQNVKTVLNDFDTREAAQKNEKPTFEWMAVENPRLTGIRAHAVSDHDAYVRINTEAKAHIGGWEWLWLGDGDWDRDWMEDDVDVRAEIELLVSNEEDVAGYTVLSLSPSGVPEEREPDFDDIE
jgi:hypothetical protein